MSCAGEDGDIGARAPSARRLVALLGLAAVVLAIHALIGPRNFTGWDEWPLLDLSSRGLPAAPHSNRPLAFLWVLPAPWLAPSPFDGFHLLHAFYLLGAGLATLVLTRRLLGGALLPWSAGLTAAVWAPADSQRLATVFAASPPASSAFAAAAAMALFVESWWRQSRWLLGAAALVAFAAIRSYEPSGVLLAGTPLALFALPRASRARALTWLAVFGGGLAIAVVLALVPPAGALPGQLYQEAAALDPHPSRVAPRLAHLLALLVLPALGAPPSALTLAASVAPILTLLLGAPLAIGDPTLGRGDARRTGRVALIGVAWTSLGLLPFALSAVFATGERTQFLSAPGFGIALAALLALAGARLGRRLAAVLALVVTVWLAFVIAVRTVAMQKEWDERSMWPRQRSLLAQLASTAPGLRPDTLLILLDQTRAFESTFAFRHAIRYLYDGKASGWVVGARDLDLFYPTRPAADGIHADVWPLHQRPWRESPRVYPYDQVIVVWADTTGRLHLLRRWPEGALPPLPPGARYDPESRVQDGVPSLRARRLLADTR